MSSYEKILIGNSIPLEEVDDEEGDLDYLIPKAEIDADFSIILNSFGNDEFKFIFMNLYDQIKSFSFEKQRELCEKLNDKVFEIYEFEFVPSLKFDNENIIDNFLKFIEFLEYDYIGIIGKIVSGLDMNLLKNNVDKFLENNFEKMNQKIIFLVENKMINEIISNFLRTNNRERLLTFFKNRIEKDKMLIILETLEGELKNE